MDKNVEQELAALRQSVNELGERLEKLEQMVGSGVEPPVVAPGPEPEAPTPMSEAPAPMSEAPAPMEPMLTSDAPPPEQVSMEPAPTSGALPAAPEAPAQAPDQSLETRIGLYWLNRIGVASLVIGVALLILYSFQYFGPLAKLATGLSISAALIALGEWLGAGRGLSWYGQGLIGGGWSLAYFTVYAMHFVRSVRVIESPVADAVLLLAVAAGATIHAVYRKAEIIAVLAVVLGFFTVPLGRVESLSPIASAVLALSAAVLSARLKWQRLYLWAVVAAYISGMAADPGTLASWGPLEWLAHRLAHFGVFWVAFTAALFFFAGNEPGGRKRLVVGTFINAFGFFSAMYSPVAALLDSNPYWLALSLACIYAVSCMGLKRRGLNAVATTHLIIGLTLASAAVPMAFVSDWYVCLWAIEVAALAYLGLKYSIRAMRWFALGLSLVAGIQILVDLFADTTLPFMGLLLPAKCLITTTGAVSFGLAASFHRSARFAGQQGERERRWFYYLYFLGASALAWLIPPLAFYHRIGGEPWLPAPTANGLLPVWWTLEAASAITLGVLGPSRLARIVGMLGLIVAGWALIIFFDDWTWAGSLTIITCLYGLGHLHRRCGGALGSDSTLGTWFSVAGSVFTTLCIGSKATGGWVSPAWTLQGLLLLLAGFRLPDRWFRVSGLLVFALVVFKLLFVDLAGAATIQRILSFIGAGVVLLVASYAYGKYAAHVSPGDRDSR